jgi:hypothetical protein
MSSQHFQPGPPEYVQQLDEKVSGLSDLIRELIKTADKQEVREYSVQVGGQTDGTGFLRAYVELPQGYAFHVHRINLEAVNPATGVAYLPSAPYTAGNVSFYKGEPGLINRFDFAPPSVGSSVFPQISTDGNKQAAILRGERLVMVVTGGPASSQVVAIIGGRLETL